MTGPTIPRSTYPPIYLPYDPCTGNFIGIQSSQGISGKHLESSASRILCHDFFPDPQTITICKAVWTVGLYKFLGSVF